MPCCCASVHRRSTHCVCVCVCAHVRARARVEAWCVHLIGRTWGETDVFNSGFSSPRWRTSCSSTSRPPSTLNTFRKPSCPRLDSPLHTPTEPPPRLSARFHMMPSLLGLLTRIEEGGGRDLVSGLLTRIDQSVSCLILVGGSGLRSCGAISCWTLHKQRSEPRSYKRPP